MIRTERFVQLLNGRSISKALPFKTLRCTRVRAPKCSKCNDYPNDAFTSQNNRSHMILTPADTFNQQLPADPNHENTPRQVSGAAFSYATPRVPSNPTLVHYSKEMVEAIGVDQATAESEEFLKIVSGAAVIPSTEPYAMCYGGHQFGHWAGQLGDGRAINLTEVVHNDKRWALQLKGAGVTPYSRTADGLAVLRSSVREHLCSEAMHHLGVPTTRSVSLALTGDQVMRDMLYDGNPAYEKGAVVCRAAESFVRFGNFQIFASRKDTNNLRKLTDYVIRHFYPGVEVGTKAGYVDFFRQITQRTLDMVVHWQRVGFVHGVMNTDNMSALGLTIDFGPYGWLEGYDEGWTPNTTDANGRRYRFGYQPMIGFWNLAQLGSALVPLVDEVEPMQAILDGYKDEYAAKYLAMMRAKLGLFLTEDTDQALIEELTETLQLTETDMTIFFRRLADLPADASVEGEDTAFLAPVLEAFYQPEELKNLTLLAWRAWVEKYQLRRSRETASASERRTLMNATNPKYVLRNYMAQMAIDKADTGDFSLVNELYELLKQPYAEQPENEQWFVRRPEWARNRVGCSMLSCSS